MPRMLRLPAWRWDIYGEDAEGAAAAGTLTNYSETGLMGIGGAHHPTAFYAALRGNVGAANEAFDTLMTSMKAALADPAAEKMLSPEGGYLGFMVPMQIFPVLIIMGRLQDARELSDGLSATWHAADAFAARALKNLVFVAILAAQKYTKDEQVAQTQVAVELIAWIFKLTYVLSTTWRELSPTEVISALPSPEKLGVYDSMSTIEVSALHIEFTSPLLLAAEVCEKLERPDDALLYLAIIWSTESSSVTPKVTEQAAAAAESASAEAKQAAASMVDSMRDIQSLSTTIQEFIKKAVQKGDSGITELIHTAVNMPQTPQTAGKSDEFKAEVVAVLTASDYSEVLKALFPDIKPASKERDLRPTTHSRAHALRGRMLAKLGKTDEAEAEFEKAVEIAHRTGIRLYEMFALRDLKACILDADGRGDEGTRRLKDVLKDMKGPPAELTKLLGGGLDAEAILRS